MHIIRGSGTSITELKTCATLRENGELLPKAMPLIKTPFNPVPVKHIPDPSQGCTVRDYLSIDRYFVPGITFYENPIKFSQKEAHLVALMISIYRTKRLILKQQFSFDDSSELVLIHSKPVEWMDTLAEKFM